MTPLSPPPSRTPEPDEQMAAELDELESMAFAILQQRAEDCLSEVIDQSLADAGEETDELFPPRVEADLLSDASLEDFRAFVWHHAYPGPRRDRLMAVLAALIRRRSPGAP